MGAFFTAILTKIASVISLFLKLAVAVFTSLWDMAKDAFCWPFEQLLKIVVSAITTFDVSAFSGKIGVWGQLPGEILNVLGLLGVGTAITIIGAAITIRLGLQLIPFVRLGS